MQWEEEEEEEKEARAHVATGPERCRQHYRERCRKCFPPPKSALATKKRNTEASTRRWRRADGNGNAQVALQRLDALATTTDTDAAANWRAGAGGCHGSRRRFGAAVARRQRAATGSTTATHQGAAQVGAAPGASTIDVRLGATVVASQLRLGRGGRTERC
eukprot:ctg_2556.g509